MHPLTQKVLQLFQNNPDVILHAEDVSEQAQITHKEAQQAMENLARYKRITHIGTSLFIPGPRANDRV